MKRALVIAAVAVTSASAAVGCGSRVTGVALDPPAMALSQRGASASFRALPKDRAGATVGRAVPRVTFYSSDPRVATVDGYGRVTALRSGEAMITALVDEVSAAARVLVAIPGSVALTPGHAEIVGVGGKGRIQARAFDDAGRPLAEMGEVAWTSSDESVVTVEGGEITAVGPGLATVTAALGGVKAKAPVAVKLPEFAKLSVEPLKYAFASKGGQVRLKTAVLDEAGAPVEGVPVRFQALEPDVAQVKPDGTITALRKGNARIRARAGAKTVEVWIAVQN